MGYPGRQNIYEATIRRMVNQAIQQQEQVFQEAHGNDTDEELITYLRNTAAELGHTPWPKEIVGGMLIESRFGTWQNALQLAKLAPPPKNISSARIQEERTRQEAAYRQKKAEKKLRAQQRQAQQAKKKQPV